MPDALTIALLLALAFAGLSAAMTLFNLPIYRSAPRADASARSTDADPQPAEPVPPPCVFVCIPARNEQANIDACVRRALASTHRNLRVLVYDDQSTDDTPNILARLIAEDPRVATVPTVPLPPGWVGKMHACHQLGTAAANAATSEHDRILFIDADVRIDPTAIGDALRAAAARKADLLSTFPRQELGTIGEKLVVPMIHFILFSYLPMRLMRTRPDIGLGAGCGQFLFIRARTYQHIGGHQSFKESMHDGIKMPRAVRAAGGTTDLFDATPSVSCRMYDSWPATWRGFTKNAYEGLGSPLLLMVFTVMHLVGHIFPWAFLIAAPLLDEAPSATNLGLALAAVVLNITQRLTLAGAFRQPRWIALAHPISVALMTIIQWHSFALALTNRRTWRGRTFAPSA